MNNFDANMMGLIGLILFLGVFVITFFKEAIVPLIGFFFVVLMIWGDDVCSRKDRLALYTEHFNAGGEIICKDDTAHPLLLSKKQGWQIKGEYFFQGGKGVDIVDDECEIIGKTEPHCIEVSTQIMIGSTLLVVMFGWMLWVFRHVRKIEAKTMERDHENDHEAKR